MGLSERERWRVRDDAHDSQPRERWRLSRAGRRAVRGDALTDRILVRKELVGEHAADDDDRLAALDVAAIDAAAAENPHAHRFEVAAGDRTKEGDRRNRTRRIDPSLDAKRVAVASERERQGEARGR